MELWAQRSQYPGERTWLCPALLSAVWVGQLRCHRRNSRNKNIFARPVDAQVSRPCSFRTDDVQQPQLPHCSDRQHKR